MLEDRSIYEEVQNIGNNETLQIEESKSSSDEDTSDIENKPIGDIPEVIKSVDKEAESSIPDFKLPTLTDKLSVFSMNGDEDMLIRKRAVVKDNSSDRELSPTSSDASFELVKSDDKTEA